MRKYILLCLFSLLFLSPKRAFAAGDRTSPGEIFNVTPIILKADLIPSLSKSYTITIQNLLPTSLGLHATIEDFKPDGEDDLIVTNHKQDPILSWSTIETPDVLMAPGEEKTISVTIKPSALAENGNYYELVFLTPFFDQQATPTHPIVLSRVGILMAGTIGTVDYSHLKAQAKISSLSLKKLASKKLSATIYIQNAGAYEFDAKPVVTVTSLFGKHVTSYIQDKHVLPHTQRIFSDTVSFWSNQFLYHIHAAVSLGNGETIEKSQWVLLVPINLLPFVGVLIVGLCLLLFIVAHKRIGKAFRILIGRG